MKGYPHFKWQSKISHVDFCRSHHSDLCECHLLTPSLCPSPLAGCIVIPMTNYWNPPIVLHNTSASQTPPYFPACHPPCFGCVQADEGLFWRVRCNGKLKKQTSINLHGYFETLTQWILQWVKIEKCRKLNDVSKYIIFFYWKCCLLSKVRYFVMGTFLFFGQIIRYMFLWVRRLSV